MSNRLNHLVAARLVQERGRTVTSIASDLGMDRSNLAHMLAGRRQFPAEQIPALAELLAVSPYELLGPEDPRAAVVELAKHMQIRPEELVG